MKNGHYLISEDIVWKVYRDLKSGYWIGICDKLKQTASSLTYSELILTIDEIVQSLMKCYYASYKCENIPFPYKLVFLQKSPKMIFDAPYKVRFMSQSEIDQL